MSTPHPRWDRLFGVYFVLTATLLVIGYLMPPPAHDVLLVIAVCLMGGFLPLLMAIYFFRGVLRIR